MLRGRLHCFNVGFEFLHSTRGFGLKKKMHLIVNCCIILHNVILEDEIHDLSEHEKEYFLEYDKVLKEPPLSMTKY